MPRRFKASRALFASSGHAKTDWIDITRRNARSVQTTIGWAFWDPGALARFEALGHSGPLGYKAARAAPLGPADPDAINAAFGSISPLGIRLATDLVATNTAFDEVWAARDEAVVEGPVRHTRELEPLLASLGEVFWPVIDELPSVGRVFFAAHRRMPKTTNQVPSAWHAMNALREGRGDTHWALVATAGLDGTEASILHNACLGYEPDWLATRRKRHRRAHHPA